ncbi:nucleotidyltransferase domain-containing protein [Actinoplanes sp. G11-F43]|uniref:nucleotidyltransferase domain-containing protein n=1 Tax=Actinoplanes sp. G11-F43 TaxID=3424130 RepID=UPI003D32F619
MTRQTAADALPRLPSARATWLSTATTVLSSRPFVTAVWLEGSLGGGVADAFSDIDLVVAVDESAPPEVFADPVSGLGLPGRLLYVRDKPMCVDRTKAFAPTCS